MPGRGQRRPWVRRGDAPHGPLWVRGVFDRVAGWLTGDGQPANRELSSRDVDLAIAAALASGSHYAVAGVARLLADTGDGNLVPGLSASLQLVAAGRGGAGGGVLWLGLQAAPPPDVLRLILPPPAPGVVRTQDSRHPEAAGSFVVDASKAFCYLEDLSGLGGDPGAAAAGAEALLAVLNSPRYWSALEFPAWRAWCRLRLCDTGFEPLGPLLLAGRASLARPADRAPAEQLAAHRAWEAAEVAAAEAGRLALVRAAGALLARLRAPPGGAGAGAAAGGAAVGAAVGAVPAGGGGGGTVEPAVASTSAPPP